MPSILLIILLLLPLRPAAAAAPGVYTDQERAALIAYWNTPGRLQTSVPWDIKLKGLWQVRLTPEASAWFLRYQIAVGQAKAPPTQDPTATAPPTLTWKHWVDRKLAYDRWKAQTTAESANIAVGILPSGPPLIPPPFPGPMPQDLFAATGDPPAFAAAIVPKTYSVTFEDGEIYDYVDNVQLPATFAYYRFPQGTAVYGAPLRDVPDAQLDPLFTAAGFSPSEQRVAKAVSRLEGTFESINTYDTGYVSIGFLQFITGIGGKGSLMEVLQQEKADQPSDYNRDFHSRGMDLNADGTLVIVDPDTGVELSGPPAVQKIISDIRLTAIFQRAGRHSVSFRVAQIKVAKSHYWPLEDTVHVTLNGQSLSARVSDIIKSEAGIATLFDRKVNRGNIDPLSDVVTKVMLAHHLQTFADLAPFEREIIKGVKYRTDFLQDKTLSQPP